MRSCLMFFIAILFVSCSSSLKSGKLLIDNIPIDIKGDFKDDYDIAYTINDSVWIQHPNVKYHLISYDSKGQYFIAHNDAKNPGEAGLYTRIDVMYFQNMEPFRWGFCFTKYNAKTEEEAKSAAAADRTNPRKGCGGYPFSRMKRAEKFKG
jgi:hypothetical protein